MLKHLDLSFSVKLEYLPSSIGDLQIQHLNLEGCFFLADLPDSIFSISTLVHVERATTNFSSKVDKLRNKLDLKGSYAIDGGNGDLWSQIAELEKEHCLELEIEGLENAMLLEGAEQAKLSNNSNLTWLSLEWDHDEGSEGEDSAVAAADKSVLEKLLPPRSLQHISLNGYKCINFPAWMLDITSYLPHLTTILLANLQGCKHLPPLGGLPNLRLLSMNDIPNLKTVGKEFYGDYRICQKLRVIVLHSMDSLEEWWTTRSSNEDGEFLIPNLHLLYVEDCPKLKFLPYPPRSMAWYVENSDHVLPEHGFGNLSSTTSPFFLGVSGLSLSSEVWGRIQYLSSVERLDLQIVDHRTLPDAIRCFTSLRQLCIFDCYDLEELPEWFGDFTSLREIQINLCRNLSALPESIRHLTGLKKLRIIDCPALSEKCRGEDKHKIAHVPEVIFE
jgi:aquaporin TIP